MTESKTVAATLPSGVVTFLLTDIEDSTALWDADREAMAGALVRHDELVARHVEAAGGVLIKSKGEGDATLSVFQRASDALAAAVDLQEALEREEWTAGITLRVRMALHTGEAYERGGDYYGPIVNRAARLRALAYGGQVLVSQATAELVRDHMPTGAALVALGRRQLRGLARDEGVFSLDRPARSDVAVAPAPERVALGLPAPLASPEGGVFVGRDGELERLSHLWEQARGGGRRAVLVAGEPGIGKTQLVAEAARRAHTAGGLVLYGRCDEEMLVPYQPFVEALRPYVLACPAIRLRDQLQGLGGELARVMPQLHHRLHDLPSPLPGEPETERYRLFEAVTALVTGMARAQPVMLVLDDLQWADKPTLLLFRYLLRSAEEAGLLVAGTYRDIELGFDLPLSELLVDLRREHLVERITLSSLPEPDGSRLLEVLAGRDVAPEFREALYRVTEGNPFFLEEVLRHLSETGAVFEREGRWATALSFEELGLPEGVREVVARRLLRLSAETGHVLSLASVIGTEFDMGLLSHASDLGPDRVLEALEEAAGARLIDEVAEVPGRFRFSHVLTRETVYRELASARRARLHLRIGQTIERLHESRLESHLAELALHFSEAAQTDEATTERAVEYSRRAGDQALALLAYEEAAGHYARALHALELEGAPDQALHGKLLLSLGEAYWRAGEREQSRGAFLRAVDLARATKAAELLGAAALGLGTGQSSREGFEISGMTDETVVALLQEALAALPAGDSPVRARLLGRLAVATYRCEPRGRRVELSREAVAMAERTGDPAARLGTLVSRRYALWDPDGVGDRMATANEIVTLAERQGRADRALEGRLYRIMDLLELGEVFAADREIARYQEDARHLRQPYYVWYATVLPAMRALLDGRFEEGEKLAVEALARGERAQDPAALTCYGAQMLWLWTEQGRDQDLEPIGDAILEIAGAMPAAQSGVAWISAELGRLDQARAALDRLAADDFAAFPRDVAWLSGLATVVFTCADLGDAERAATLYPLLLPYAGRNVMVWAHVSFGPVDRLLGLLASLVNHHDDAVVHFEAAMKMSEAMWARPFVAHTQQELADTLLMRGKGDDRERATRLLREALTTARELGMAPLAARAEAGLESAASRT
jgi:class 3 adenylate cyclase/tetratricopeptide (TPR) repeat protein